MNKYEKQFNKMLADQLDPSQYDKNCEIEKCMGCSASGCPFKQKLQEEYLIELFVNEFCDTEENKEIMRNAIKSKDPAALELFKNAIANRK